MFDNGSAMFTLYTVLQFQVFTEAASVFRFMIRFALGPAYFLYISITTDRVAIKVAKMATESAMNVYNTNMQIPLT